MRLPAAASFRVIEQTDRRLEVELPPVPANPETASEQIRPLLLHGLIAAGCIAAVVVTLTHAGAGWAFNLGLLLMGFVIVSLNTMWVSLRVAVLCRSDCPQRLIVSKKRLTHIVGRGWAAIGNKLPLKHIRSVQPIDQDAAETQSNRSGRFAVVMMRWNFTPLFIAEDLLRKEAQALAWLIFECCNRHLGHPVATDADAIDAPVTLGSLDVDLQSNFLREVTRPPPISKARIAFHNEITRIEIPTNRINKHLSGSASAAIILGFVATVGWLIYFGVGPGLNWGLAVLIGMTLLVALFTAAAWRSRRAVVVVELGDNGLKITRTRLYRNDVHDLSYDQVRDITYEVDTAQAVTECRIHYAQNKKLKLLAGHPEDEVVWMVALLRWAAGLNETSDE